MLLQSRRTGYALLDDRLYAHIGRFMLMVINQRGIALIGEMTAVCV